MFILPFAKHLLTRSCDYVTAIVLLDLPRLKSFMKTRKVHHGTQGRARPKGFFFKSLFQLQPPPLRPSQRLQRPRNAISKQWKLAREVEPRFKVQIQFKVGLNSRALIQNVWGVRMRSSTCGSGPAAPAQFGCVVWLCLSSRCKKKSSVCLARLHWRNADFSSSSNFGTEQFFIDKLRSDPNGANLTHSILCSMQASKQFLTLNAGLRVRFWLRPLHELAFLLLLAAAANHAYLQSKKTWRRPTCNLATEIQTILKHSQLNQSLAVWIPFVQL